MASFLLEQNHVSAKTWDKCSSKFLISWPWLAIAICRFFADKGANKLKGAGLQQDSSALRDEVCFDICADIC